MTYGCTFLASEDFCEAFFDVAAELENGISFFANREFADPEFFDAKKDQYWAESFVRPVEFSQALWKPALARYHPTWGRPFGKMCWHCNSRIHSAIAMPLDCSDEEAERVYHSIDAVTNELVELQVKGKRIKTVLSRLSVPNWALCIGFTYESPIALFLADQAGVASFTASCLSGRGVQVLEQW